MKEAFITNAGAFITLYTDGRPEFTPCGLKRQFFNSKGMRELLIAEGYTIKQVQP